MRGVRIAYSPVQSSPVNCCWLYPTQWFLDSGPVGTSDHIFVPSRLLLLLKWGLFLEESEVWLLLVTPHLLWSYSAGVHTEIWKKMYSLGADPTETPLPRTLIMLCACLFGRSRDGYRSNECSHNSTVACLPCRNLKIDAVYVALA
jgi:hypothetical protein